MANELEEKLGAILGNPEMMRQIQAMAQSVGQSAPQNTPSSQTGGLDLSMVQKLSSLAEQTGIDQNQQALLHAMTPYLSGGRVQKLENAMRAAKMARLASTFLGSGGLKMFTGR